MANEFIPTILPSNSSDQKTESVEIYSADLSKETPPIQNQNARSVFNNELQNSNVLERFAILMKAEVGGQGSDAQLAFAETVFNRALTQKESINSIISNTRYYEPYKNGSYNKASSNITDSEYQKYVDIINQVRNGSNITNGATHNSSGNFYPDLDKSSLVVIGGENFYRKTFEKPLNLDYYDPEKTDEYSKGNISENSSIPNPNLPDHYVSGTNPRVGGEGSAKGYFSTPLAGSKVWVFFHGGDPQRPVYFASSPEPSSWKSAYQYSSPSPNEGRSLGINNGKSSSSASHMDALMTKNGGLVFQSTDINIIDEIPESLEEAVLQSGSGNVKISTQGVDIFTEGSSSKISEKDITNTGESNSFIYGDSYTNIKGNNVILVGNHSQTGRDASQKIQNSINQIEKSKIEAIQKEKGTAIECPVCSQKYLNDKTDFVKRILNTVSKLANLLPWNCWNWPVTQFLLNTIIVPFLSEISGLAALGGKGCGACKNGLIETVQNKIEAGNVAASQELKNQQNNINEASKDVKDSAYLLHSQGDFALISGQITNDSPAFLETTNNNVIVTRNKKASNANCLVNYCGDSPAKVVVKTEPTQSLGAQLYQSSNGIKMIAGSPGFDIITKGNYKISSGGFELLASDGPVVIASKNVTTISGKTIHICDSDDGGVRISSNHTSIGGALHINGDQSVMGSITTDGSISTKHLIMPSMRSETTMSSSPKSVTDGATWYLEGSVAANTIDMARNMVMRNLNPGWLLTPSGIITMIQEVYNQTISLIPLHPLPIGFCVAYPMGILPVFGFRHTHTMPPQDHSHQITLPKGNYYNDTESWHQARPEPSHVPTPAPGQGDGAAPGPKSTGGCGGAGFGFNDSNSNASKNRQKRNSSVGLSNGDYNYTRITGGSIWKYDTDGNIIPTPEYGQTENC